MEVLCASFERRKKGVDKASSEAVFYRSIDMDAKPKTPRHDERRDEILRVALHLFATQGIEGTGLREIAKRIGVSQPALYHYFASKEALVDAVLDWRKVDAHQRQEEIARRLTQVKGLRQGMVLLAESFAALWGDPDNEDLHRLMLSQLTRGGPLAGRIERELLRPSIAWAERLFATLIELGKVRDLDPGLLAVQFVGPMLMMGLWQGHHGAAATEDRMAQLVYQHLEVLIRGIESA
jgi:AcrR family transcriptional regulator